jgi:hypothetical protein
MDSAQQHSVAQQKQNKTCFVPNATGSKRSPESSESQMAHKDHSWALQKA